MTFKVLLTASAVLLAACSTVTDETRSSAVLERGFFAGQQYEVRQRLIEGPSGNYEQTSVVYRGLSRTCNPDSPRDCELKAQKLIEDYEESIFGI